MAGSEQSGELTPLKPRADTRGRHGWTTDCGGLESHLGKLGVFLKTEEPPGAWKGGGWGGCHMINVVISRREIQWPCAPGWTLGARGGDGKESHFRNLATWRGSMARIRTAGVRRKQWETDV